MCNLFSRLIIPKNVDESERLVRFLLSPMHFKKDNTLRSNVYNPTRGTSEVSMTRLEYSTANKCKKLAKKIANNASKPNKQHTYMGFGLITKNVALNCGASDVVKDSICGNRAHAELILPGTKENVAIASRLQYVQDQLVSNTKVFIDASPQSSRWDGDVLIY